MPKPIESKHHQMMNALATVIDEALNGPELTGLPRRKHLGFVLLVAEFGKIDGGRVNYISNGEREDMVAMLREYLARVEGRVVNTGTEQ